MFAPCRRHLGSVVDDLGGDGTAVPIRRQYNWAYLQTPCTPTTQSMPARWLLFAPQPMLCARMPPLAPPTMVYFSIAPTPLVSSLPPPSTQSLILTLIPHHLLISHFTHHPLISHLLHHPTSSPIHTLYAPYCNSSLIKTFGVHDHTPYLGLAFQ